MEVTFLVGDLKIWNGKKFLKSREIGFQKTNKVNTKSVVGRSFFVFEGVPKSKNRPGSFHHFVKLFTYLRTSPFSFPDIQQMKNQILIIVGCVITKR
jgi:hypothetical protein